MFRCPRCSAELNPITSVAICPICLSEHRVRFDRSELAGCRDSPTHRLPLEDAPSAYETFQKEDGAFDRPC